MPRIRVLVIVFSTLIGFSCEESGQGFFRGIYFSRPPRELREGQGYFQIWLGTPNGSGGKNWHSILKFDNVESTNKPFLNGQDAELSLPEIDLDSVIAGAISIELENDPDPATPNRIFMSGPFVNSVATLTVYDADAIGYDLFDTSVIAGKFVLATPTDTDSTNEQSGVWFVDKPFGQGTQNAGLKLPTLPEGFSYEAWIATFSETVCISTGKFLTASGADDNGGGPNAGPDSPPEFPGEDLAYDAQNPDVQGRTVPASVQQAYLDTFAFPINIRRSITTNPLTGMGERWDVVVSIEPNPDNDPEEPFAVFPLVKFGPIFEQANSVVKMETFGAGTAQQVVIDLTKLK